MKHLILVLFILMFSTPFLFAQEIAEDKRPTEWDDYFMPGVGYKVFVPRDTASLGIYHGLLTEFVFYARAKSAASKWGGPARSRTYINLSIMESSKKSIDDIFIFNFGLNLSFESKVKRAYFIPFFGIEMGGMFHKNFGSFQISPLVGVQFVSTKRILWNMNLGYQYTTKDFQRKSGPYLSTSINALLWKT